MKKNLILILLLITSIATYGQKTTLALNLVQGNTYYMVTSAKMAIGQIISGQPLDISTTILSKMSFKVTAIKDTNYTMEARFDRIAMKMGLPNQTIDFDSESKTKNIFSTLMVNMTNKPFTIVMTKKGKVASVDGMDKVYDGLFNGLPEVSDDQKAQLKSQLMQSFGPKAFKGNIELGTAFFPDAQVGKNDSWLVTTELESVMKAEVKTTFTLNDITATSYIVHGNSAIISDDKAEYAEFNGLPMKYNVTGTSTYEVKLDKTTGWASEVKINQAIKGDVLIKDNPKVPGGMTIPLTLTDEQLITDK